MNLKSGAHLQGGRYRIISTLGRGGFGITYLAEHTMTRRRVCIKEYFPKDYYRRNEDATSIALSSDGFAESMNRYKAKFVKEAQTIATFSHPNIVPIHDAFEENDTAYYVMEYVEGGSLSDIVKGNGALDEATAVDYVRQIASALSYIHERRFMHLDIKPGNIMLRTNDERAMLIDFGLSKHYNDDGEQTSTTPVGISHGYAPFEQYKDGGVSIFSPATDIYSLGATLYYLVTGSVPPSATDIAKGGINTPTNLSPGVQRAIKEAMNYWREDRPQSIDDFLRLLDDDKVVAPIAENTIIEVEPKHDDESTIIDVEPKQTPQPAPQPKNEPKPKKSKGGLWLGIFLFVVAAVTSFILLGGGSSKKDAPRSAVSVVDTLSRNIPTTDSISSSCDSLNLVRLKVNTIANSDKPYVKPTYTEEPPKDKMAISAANATAVDLGLTSGTKWATYNVGATSPEECGNYYAWGEIVTKSHYTSASSQVSVKTMDEISGKEKYDAATANWGNEWRMPTQAEFDELVKNCNWKLYERNGVWGYEVKSKKNGNSIFLPAAGYLRDGNNKNDAGSGGYYWSSELDNTKRAYHLYFNDGGIDPERHGLYDGMSVRPVTGTKPTIKPNEPKPVSPKQEESKPTKQAGSNSDSTKAEDQKPKPVTQPNNEIWYTSSDGKVVKPYKGIFGAEIESNTYKNGKGIIKFKGDVTTIGEKAFYECKSLTSVTIPNSVTTIGNSAFASCESLTSVIIPNSVTTIGYRAFSGCSSLTSVTIPDSVTTIGDGAFNGCRNIKEFKGGSAFINGRCLVINGKLVAFAPAGITKFTIPDSVTEIGNYAFLGCKNLTSVTIPNGVTTIGGDAFLGCKNLTSVTIPDSVTTIGDSAFRECPNLTTINIPNRVTTIGEHAFEECCSIKSITIPNSVKTIGRCAFDRCSSLTSVTISNSITAIHEFTFNECSNLKSVAIPKGVKHIGDFAFKGCDMLESVTLPYSIEEIGWDAFFGCRNLITVYCDATIPPSISESSFASSKYRNYFGNIVYEYNCTIYVPSYAVDNYKKQFSGKMNKKNILGVSFN